MQILGAEFTRFADEKALSIGEEEKESLFILRSRINATSCHGEDWESVCWERGIQHGNAKSEMPLDCANQTMD